MLEAVDGGLSFGVDISIAKARVCIRRTVEDRDER